MANNLLVDWLNKKPNLQKANVQSVVNNNTASNAKNVTAPELKLGGVNLQKAQANVNAGGMVGAGSVAGVNLQNKPTLNTLGPGTKSNIVSNNPAFNNGGLVTQNNPSNRFIGFQQQPTVPNTVMERTPEERQGLNWQGMLNGQYAFVPSEVSRAEAKNAAEENRFRTMSEAFYDLQGDLYNRGKILNDYEIKQKYPEFKSLDMSVLKELQNELLPIVKDGMGVDADQLSQYYPELLKGKELNDIDELKGKIEKGNEWYKGRENALKKVAKGDVEGMSSEGVQSVQDAKTIRQMVQAIKKQGVVGGGSDYEILKALYEKNPEAKKLMDNFNSRELTEKDKAIRGREDASLLREVFHAATDPLRKDDEFMKSDEELTSLTNKAKAMEDDYWGQVGGTARVGLRSTADTWEKFIYRMSQDAKLWTIEDIDEYLKQSKENERNVAEYNASVDRETENVAQNTINQDVRDYYNNHTMSRSLALGDVPGFFLQSTKSATENVDMPIIIAAGVVAPEVVLPLMATDTYVRESEGAFEELLKNGASYDDAEQGAVTVGIANTVVELFLEKALGGVETTASKAIRDALMKDISKKTTEMVASRGLTELLKQGAITQFRSSLEEGLEEIVQQSIENYAVSKYNPDVNITDGLREAFEGGFFNPMNLLAGGGDIMSNIDVDAANQRAYNQGVKTRNAVDNAKNALNQGAYNAGAFLGNMTEDFKNSFTPGGANNNQGGQQQGTVNTTSENQNNINGQNYNQNTKNNKTLNSVQLGMLQNDNRMNPSKITEFKEKFGVDYGQALADMGYTESQETNVPKIEEDTKDIYNKKKEAMNAIEGEFQDRSLRDMLNIMIKKAKNTLDYDMLDKYQALKQKHQSKGLTMAEANDMREEFSYKVKTKWGGDGNSDKIDLANNVYSAVKNFLEKKAEEGGMKDLKQINRDIAMRKYLSTWIGDKAERQSANNMVSLTDRVILAEAVSNPYAAAGFAAKKIAQKPRVKNAVLNAVVGRRENRAIDTQNRQTANQERLESIEKANEGKRLQQELSKPTTPALPNGIKLTKVTEVDARKNNKPKNTVTKKSKSENNKKSDSSSNDDTNPPSGGTPTGNGPTNTNPKGTAPTSNGKNNVTQEKKAEPKKEVKAQPKQDKQEAKRQANVDTIKKYADEYGIERDEELAKNAPTMHGDLIKEFLTKTEGPITFEKHGDGEVAAALDTNLYKKNPQNLSNTFYVGGNKADMDFLRKINRPETENTKAYAKLFEVKEEPENVVTKKSKVTEKKQETKKAEPKPVENSELREKIGDTYYNYLEKQLDIVNKSREANGEPPLKIEELDLTSDYYRNGFHKVAQEQIKKIQQEMEEATKDFPKAPALTEEQKKQLSGKTSQAERNKLLKKWQDEWIKKNPITDEQAARVEEIMDKAAKVTDDYNKAMNYLEDLEIEEENKETEDHYSEESKAEMTKNDKNKVTNVTVTKGGNITPDNSEITGRFRNLTREEYQTMQNFGGLETLYLNGELDTINTMLQLKDTVGYLDPAEYNLPEDLELDYHDFLVREDAKTVAELENILGRIENDTVTQEDIDNYGEDFYKEGKDGKGERDTKGMIEMQEDLISQMFLNTLGDDIGAGKAYVSSFYDIFSDKMDRNRKGGDGFFKDQVKDVNENVKKLDDIIKKYGRYWEQGNSNERWNNFVKNATDIDNLDNNETPQMPTIFEEDLEQMNLRDLGDNETPQTALEEMEKSAPKTYDEIGQDFDSYDTWAGTKSYYGKVGDGYVHFYKTPGLRGFTVEANPHEYELFEGVPMWKVEEGKDTRVLKFIDEMHLSDFLNNAKEKGLKQAIKDLDTKIIEARKAEKENKPKNLVTRKETKGVDAVQKFKDQYKGYDDTEVLTQEKSFSDPETGNEYVGTYSQYLQWLTDNPNVNVHTSYNGNPFAVIKYGDYETEGHRLEPIAEPYMKFLKDNPEIRENSAKKLQIQDYVAQRKEDGNDFQLESKKEFEEGEYSTLPEYISINQEASLPKTKAKRIAPSRIAWQQETYKEGVDKVFEQVKTIAEYIKGYDDYNNYRYALGEENRNFDPERYKQVKEDTQHILFGYLTGWGFKSAKSKKFIDLWKNITNAKDNESKLRDIAKNVYIDLVKKDVGNGYMYPQAIIDSVPGIKTAKDKYLAYIKGWNTSFSQVDARKDSSLRDTIGADLKRQDGKTVTEEFREYVKDGMTKFGKALGLDVKRLNEDLGLLYADLDGKNPFLIKNASGVYHPATRVVSVHGGGESFRFKNRDGTFETVKIPTTFAHELTHAIDHILNWSLFSKPVLKKLRNKMNKVQNSGRGMNYWGSEEEITARMVQEYVGVKEGVEDYYSRGGYRTKEIFDSIIVPEVERAFRDKLGDYYQDPNTVRYQKVSNPDKITVYHGTENVFDKFSNEFDMSSQPGGNTYGPGIYVTQDLDMAKSYGGETPGKRRYVTYKGGYSYKVADKMESGMSFEKAVASAIKEQEKARNEYVIPKYQAAHTRGINKAIQILKNMKEEDFTVQNLQRRYITLEIDNLHDADTPTGKNYFETDNLISEEGLEKIQDAFKKKFNKKLTKKALTGKGLYNDMVEAVGDKRKIRDFLSDLGYDGIKYRHPDDGDSFVIFKDSVANKGIKSSTKYQNVLANSKNKITAAKQETKKQTSPLSQKELDALNKQMEQFLKTGLANGYKYHDSQIDFVKEVEMPARLQAVWHGSPADFDRFDSTHMSEGEGAQAHGWGHYVAKNKTTAKGYAEMRGNGQWSYKGKNRQAIRDMAGLETEEEKIALRLMARMEEYGRTFDRAVNDQIRDYGGYIKTLEERIEAVKRGNHRIYDTVEQAESELRKAESELNILKNMSEADFKKTTKNLYQVEIPDLVKKDTPTGTNYREESKNVTSKQFEKIAEKLKEQYPYQYNNPNGWYDQYLFGQFLNFRQGGFSEKMTGKEIYNMISEIVGSDKAASKFLESLGYDGIHYYGGRDGEAYVIFNDDTLDITDHIKYLKADNGDIAGAVTPDGVIHLILPNLRRDTAAHEFSHLLRSYAKKNSPELFNAINKIAQDAPQELKDYVKRTYGDLSEDAFLDEVFAWRQGQYSGIKSAQTWYQRMWSAIVQLWNNIKSKFGSKYANLDVFEAYQQMGSEELMKKVDDLLKGGKEIGQGGGETQFERAGGIRSNNFKNWFGDWENDPENASKVVKDNGTPKIVYHGTNADFTVFNKIGGPGIYGDGYYFTDKLGTAKNYGRDGGKVMKVYLNIKNPYIAKTIDDQYQLNVKKLKEQGYDGVRANLGNETYWVAFDSNQVKSATDNVGTYDANNDDIRYERGDGIPMSEEQGAKYKKKLKYYNKVVHTRGISRKDKYYIISRMNYMASEIKEKTGDKERKDRVNALKNTFARQEIALDGPEVIGWDNTNKDRYGYEKQPGPFLWYDGKRGFHVDKEVRDYAQSLK